MAASVMIAVGDVQPIIEKMVAETNAMTLGEDMGSIINPQSRERIEGFITDAESRGARVLVDGRGATVNGQPGDWVGPTIIDHVTPEMPCASEEIFGPVLSIIGYEDEEDAVRIANDTRYGLSGYVSSGDLDRARNVARRVRTGMVHLNGAPLDPKAPFGGYKESGVGREWGHYGFDDFLEVKSIYGYAAKA